jgi:hypothetical protein
MATEQEVELNVETGEELSPETIEVNVIEKPDEVEAQHDDEEALQVETQEHEEASGDRELDDASDDAEREEIRARRREERRNRKVNQREREDTLRRELAARDSIINEMRSRLDAVERRNTGSEQAQLENAKKGVAREYAYYKEQIKLATEASNGEAVAEATEKMMLAQRKFDQLTAYEQANRKQGVAAPQLDPRLISNAKNWMEKNTWYNPGGTDADSRIVLTIDHQLAEEGWSPVTSDYWEQLDERVKKYLPHRVNRGKINSKPKSVVTGSGREGVSSNNAGSFKLSAERVAALKDAGIWDDPKQRADAAKRFREYDQQQKKA